MKFNFIFIVLICGISASVEAMEQHEPGFAQKNIIHHLQNKQSLRLLKSSLPSEARLKMNDTVVNTNGPDFELFYVVAAAADAASKGKTEQISPNCLAQLSQYYSGLGNLKKTWSRLERYGYVVKSREQEAGCLDIQGSMSYEAYHQVSKSLNKAGVLWFPLLDENDRLFELNNLMQVLEEVKKSLSHGSFVTFAFTQPQDFIFNGSFRNPNDALIMTYQLERHLGLRIVSFIERAVIITGYNDNALIVDSEGDVHQGVITLRDFSGSEQKDLYMSYDYFLIMAVEAQRVLSVD